MYDDYFGFQLRPFPSMAQSDQYYPATSIENARVALERCIERDAGVGAVFGAAGTGKTLLCQVLAEQFHDALRVVILSAGRLGSRRNLFQAILYGLGRPYRGMDEGELRLALQDFLIRGDDCPQGLLLLIDEAHTLSLRLLDELRMLTNVVCGGQPRVRLVLFGACILEERFASPKLDSFNQRLVARCYLEPLSRAEVQDYVWARVGLALGKDIAADPDSVAQEAQAVFPVEVCRGVFQATDGIPRLINQLCDHALMLAYVGQRQELTPADVEEAWADLQQLPTRLSEENAGESDGNGVIEFGGLDEPPADAESPKTQKFSLPSLRISPESERDEAAPAPGDPERQFRRIERLLDNVNDDFQPAGTIGPEVELVFSDPFAEPFEREEVVADRYAPRSEPEPAVSCETSDAETCVFSTEADAAGWDFEQEPEGTGDRAEPAAVAIRRRVAVETEPQCEAEERTPVVEREPEKTPAARPIVAVRQREYGQLFAKLRRG